MPARNSPHSLRPQTQTPLPPSIDPSLRSPTLTLLQTLLPTRSLMNHLFTPVLATSSPCVGIQYLTPGSLTTCSPFPAPRFAFPNGHDHASFVVCKTVGVLNCRFRFSDSPHSIDIYSTGQAQGILPLHLSRHRCSPTQS